MPKKRTKKDSGKNLFARVRKEMANPRMAKSVRKKYANLASSAALAEAIKSPPVNPRKVISRTKFFEE